MAIKYSLLFIILLIVCSCGSPDSSSIYIDLNQPYITRIAPGNQKLTVHFEAQNNEEGFSGYNVYYGDNVNQKQFVLLNDKNIFPTITTIGSDVVNKYEFTIEAGQNYSNENGNGTLDGADIPNGLPRYVIVTAYNLFNNYESSYSYSNFVYMGCPRPEILNKNITTGEAFAGISTGNTGILNLGTLQNNAGILQIAPIAINGGIQMRTATSINDINVPPVDGYINTPIDAQAGRLYLMKILIGSDIYYGKIYIQSVNPGTSIVADYCVQIAAGITNY